ncbi:TPA: hypothetical protein RQN04_002034 [Aeromonas hydrophila]|nr:hypothetical protein [Aeromonas hydrophila]
MTTYRLTFITPIIRAENLKHRTMTVRADTLEQAERICESKHPGVRIVSCVPTIKRSSARAVTVAALLALVASVPAQAGEVRNPGETRQMCNFIKIEFADQWDLENDLARYDRTHDRMLGMHKMAYRVSNGQLGDIEELVEIFRPICHDEVGVEILPDDIAKRMEASQ